ncbi:uncharacterized protein LOC131900200 [Peromyscus eremicus]|uniref:uncharacterized protein LOC131900200 n=1 Tax=Peromyscus eremicus TaxID=42410 RepID=UPI0027DDD5CE|nr:uncharacterized protein LOC131900200 [Peromyscus eremicus]
MRKGEDQGCCGPLGAGCSCSPLGVRSAPALLQLCSSPTPALLRSCSGPAPVLLQLSSATPLLELRALTPSSRLSVPLSLGVPHSHDLAPSQVPVPSLLPPQLRHSPLPFLWPSPSVRQSVCLSASPPSFSFLCPASLACSLVRLGGAASQENPRNLCKKLTMKFKKFYDFGAIFEWRVFPGSTLEKFGSKVRRTCTSCVLGVGAHGICNIKRQNVLNCEERKRRILWLLNHLAKHVAVLKGVGPWQLQSIDSLSILSVNDPLQK